MKKILALIAAMVMVLTLVSCGKKTTPTSIATDDVSTIENAEASEQQKDENTTEITQDNLRSFPTTSEDQFETTAVDDGVYVFNCSSEDKVVVVPDTIGGQPVVGIAQSAMQGLKAEGIVLPDTVREIEQGAFQSNDNLKYIYLGTSLKRMGSMPFNNCNGLLEVTFPDGMETFEDCAFYNCASLKEIVVPDSVKNIPLGIVDSETCPNAVVVTPAESTVEADCVEHDIPYRNK